MKNHRILAVAAVLGCGLALTAGAYAVDPAASSAVPKAASSSTTVEGSIAALSLEGTSPSVTIKGTSGQSWNLAFDPKSTSIWVRGQKGISSQLKVGQQVKVSYADQTGRKIAKSIKVTSGTGN